MHSALKVLQRVAITATLLTAAAEAQTSGTLKVVGLDGATKSLGAAELQTLPQMEYADSGANGTVIYRGPSIRSIVTLAGAPAGHALRGPSMTIVVLAEATDGYKVAYTLAELDEQFGARTAFVALAQNGQPLASAEGPLRVVMPGETHHARWIRQLSVLRLVRADRLP
jgi:DMSO/TMAO reductase YedYZ molybdopterin-dependent catalytic subunit